MKQHITVEQLSELSSIERKKLQNWWKPQPGDKLAYIDGIDSREDWLVEYDVMWYFADAHSLEQFITMMRDGDTILPLLSIGQMIEFLGDEVFSIEFEVDMWFVKLQYNNYNERELADALWEAVKGVLC
jgi:hypothetical protein